MAIISVEFDAVKSDEVKRIFQTFISRASNPRPVFADFGAYMVNSVRTNFLMGGRPKWPGLRPQTVWNWVLSRKSWRKGPVQGGRLSARGLKAMRGRKVLINTARLMGSIFFRASSGGVDVGTRTKYANIHQFGGVIPARTILPTRKKALYWPGAGSPVKRADVGPSRIPARPFLVVQPEDWDYLIHRMILHL